MSDSDLYNTEEILALLKPRQLDDARFVAQSHFMGSPNVFGGQVLGQSLAVAAGTVEGRRPHSMHALFLLRGNHRLPIEYEVERVRDGGSFSTRRVVAFQEGRRIFVMSASFQASEEGLSHQKPAPAAADPESLPSGVAAWKAMTAARKLPFHPVPVDFRSEHGSFTRTDAATPFNRYWIKSPIHLPDDALVHETLFAYMSDYGLLATALQPHMLQMHDPRLQLASLDHTIWFHRPFRMDEWLLLAIETPHAGGGRGLSFAHVYNRSGDMVATLAQEGLMRMRLPAGAPEKMPADR